MNAARPLSATPPDVPVARWRLVEWGGDDVRVRICKGFRGQLPADRQRYVHPAPRRRRGGSEPHPRPSAGPLRGTSRGAVRLGRATPRISCPSRPLSWRISAQPARRGKEGFNRGLRCPPRFAPALRPLRPGRCSRRGRPRRHGAAVAGSHNRGTGRRPSRLPGRRRMATPDRPSRPAPAPPRWRGEREPRRRAAAAPRSPAARSESCRRPRQSDGQLLHAGSRARAGLTAVGSASAPAWPSPPSPSAP